MGVYLRGKSWYIDFYYEGKRYTEKVGKVSKSVAEEKLDIKRSEAIRGEWKPKIKKISFEDFSKDFMEKYAKINVKPKSYKRHESSLKHLIPFFGNQSISEINPFIVEKYKSTRKAEGAGPATTNRELACLRHMLNMAVSWKKLRSLPFGFGKKKDVKFLPEPEGKDRILSEEEETRLLEAVRLTTKSQHLEPIIITALNTGMRKGEILNLKWSNVDFKTGHILVEGTKNGEIRRVPMNEKLTATLESAKKVSKGEYVFSEDGENPYGDVKTGWWTALERAKIEGFRFHDLRHTFGSRLGMAGVDIRTIQELMGHKDIKMTMRYSHPTPEHKKNAVKMLDSSHNVFHNSEHNPDLHKVVSIR